MLNVRFIVLQMKFLLKLAELLQIRSLCSSKCVPVLLYGLEACPLNISDLRSLDFVIDRFFMKLFITNHINTVRFCQVQCGYQSSFIIKSRRAY